MKRHAHGSFRRLLVIAILATASLLLLPGLASAQAHRLGAGWTVGVSDVGALNSNVNADRLAPGAGFVVGLHVDQWFGGQKRFGLRTQASFQQPQLDWNTDARDIATVSADLSLMVRPIAPGGGSPVLPYLAGGLGGIWYDLGSGPETTFPGADTFHDGKSRVLPVGLIALGVDIPTGFTWGRYPVGVRLEAADHITLKSPLRSISDGSYHDAVHQMRFTVGLHSAFSY